MTETQRCNILFVSHYAAMYGANQSLCCLLLALREHYQVNPIVLLPGRGPICDFLDQHAIKYYVIHYYWWVNSGKGLFQLLLNLRKQIMNRLGIGRILKAIAAENVQLVYTNSITINIGVFLSKKLQCHHIWHIRESMEQLGFKFSMGALSAIRLLDKGAERYIVVSDYLRSAYQKLLPAERVRRVYNGVSLDGKGRKGNVLADVLNLCIVGVVCEQKNQLDALKAVRLLKSRGAAGVRLHIVGSYKEDYRSEVEKYINENSLQGQVVFYGHRSDVHEILSNMNLGLMCSRGEAFGRVSLEYMLHRMPVIASRSGANEEIIIPGMNGALYELGNPEELADSIEGFIKKPELLETLGRAALEYVTNNFSSEQNARKIYGVIEELLIDLPQPRKGEKE